MMPVSIGWGNDEKNVILATIEWPWTWDELSLTWKTGTEMINNAPFDVHMIVVAKTTRFPVGNILSNLTGITKRTPENIGLAIMVTDNRFQEAINNIFFKLSPGLRQKGRVVSSVDKAYALVAEVEANGDIVR